MHSTWWLVATHVWRYQGCLSTDRKGGASLGLKSPRAKRQRRRQKVRE